MAISSPNSTADRPYPSTNWRMDARRRDQDPSYFEDIKLTFRASGDGLAKDQLEKAVGLSVDKYCSVSVMLREKATITYECVVE